MDSDFYHSNRIRVRHSGSMDGLPEDVQKEIVKVQAATAEYDAVTAILAINYGGRDEIMRAFAKYREAETGQNDQYSVEAFQNYLDNPDIPDPDLIIRTAGEMRLSNFLLWESAYSELYFSDKLWPDWGPDDLLEALEHYSRRKRKFGGTT